jgi:hypothetical protein
MEIGDGEEFLPARLDPLLFLQKLTLGTMPVPAGVIGYLYMAAVLALVDVSPEFRGPADLYGPHGAQLV